MATITTAISAEGRVRSMEHDGCKLCKYENCSMESKECIGCKQNSVDKYKRMTQADRIRSMSDEELAEFLADSEIFSPCKNCDFHFVDAMNDDCKAPDGWICTKGYAAELIQNWLQSEVEE